MAFNTTSYFAGVGTVFAAITLGFAGGFLIANPNPKAEPPNRLERVAAATPIQTPSQAQSPAEARVAVVVPKPDAAAPNPQPAVPEPGPAPQPVAEPSPAPQPAAQQQAAAQPAAAMVPVVAKDDSAEQAKTREAELKAAEKRRAHRRWVERQRHQQELDAATAQVRMIDRGGAEEVVQREPPARFGFFGNGDW